MQMNKLNSLNPAKQAMTLLDEFKQFALKGNVIDLAIGVVVGGAFGKVIDSLVKNILMPLIGLLFPSEKGYLGWKFVFDGKEVPYGLFIGEVVNFLVVSLAIFVFLVKFLKFMMKEEKKTEAAPAGPPPLTKDQELLVEIRDLLKK